MMVEPLTKRWKKTNFGFAGKALSEVWSAIVIDSHPVVAEYIQPSNAEIDASVLQTATTKWRSY